MGAEFRPPLAGLCSDVPSGSRGEFFSWLQNPWQSEARRGIASAGNSASGRAGKGSERASDGMRFCSSRPIPYRCRGAFFEGGWQALWPGSAPPGALGEADFALLPWAFSQPYSARLFTDRS